MAFTAEGRLFFWTTDAKYLDPEIRGVPANPSFRLVKADASAAVKQAAKALKDAIEADMVSGKITVDPAKAPTAYDMTTGQVIPDPT